MLKIKLHSIHPAVQYLFLIDFYGGTLTDKHIFYFFIGGKVTTITVYFRLSKIWCCTIESLSFSIKHPIRLLNTNCHRKTEIKSILPFSAAVSKCWMPELRVLLCNLFNSTIFISTDPTIIII